MQLGSIVKTSSIPPLRVSQELRRQAEAVLQDGETLSSFVLNALTRSIEYRKARQAFIARGLASAARAQQTGRYVSADRVVGQLERRLAKAKRGVAKVR
jgi:predicted transcriptional regulator